MRNSMRTPRSIWVVLLAIGWSVWTSPAMRAQDQGASATGGTKPESSQNLAQRVEDLEKQIGRLESELSTVKQQLSHSAAPAPASAAAPTPATSSTAQATAPATSALAITIVPNA